MHPPADRDLVNYFAYASNMSSATMQAACPSHRLIGPARLSGHRLAFTRRSVRSASGVADVVEDAAADVWGVLYELDEDDFALLDRKEGRGWAYQRRQVVVEDLARQVHRALIYTVVHKEAIEVRPSAPYMQALLDAAVERALPGDYVASLHQLAARWELA